MIPCSMRRAVLCRAVLRRNGVSNLEPDHGGQLVGRSVGEPDVLITRMCSWGEEESL